MQRYTLECCVDSVESALAAEKGGATRLNCAVRLWWAVFRQALHCFVRSKSSAICSINVLLRPRYGDFCYTDAGN